jgi:hypothetical protein
MKILVMDKEVHKNIALFRHLILKQIEKRKEEFYQIANKAYRAFVNCKTGELSFPDLEKKRIFSSEWKPIIIQLHPNGMGAFEIIAPEKEEVFGCEDFSKKAYALFTKTIHILNQIVYDPKQGNNPFWVLRQLANIEFLLSEEEEGKRNFIHEAWHQVDREEAEQLLMHAPIGTYLFRKDPFAELLEDQLNEEGTEPVLCLTLSYRIDEDKIAEKTLVLKAGKWRFFDDDIDLSSKGFDTVTQLVQTLASEVKFPVR